VAGAFIYPAAKGTLPSLEAGFYLRETFIYNPLSCISIFAHICKYILHIVSRYAKGNCSIYNKTGNSRRCTLGGQCLWKSPRTKCSLLSPSSMESTKNMSTYWCTTTMILTPWWLLSGFLRVLLCVKLLSRATHELSCNNRGHGTPNWVQHKTAKHSEGMASIKKAVWLLLDSGSCKLCDMTISTFCFYVI